MGNSKKPRRGRAHRAQADALFERALLGEDSFSDRKFNPRQDRKTLQLCRQVQRAIVMALGGECADELLIDAYVESVEPLGGPSQLLVRVVVPAEAGPSPAEVTARLAALTPGLRTVVAAEICRKRVPALSFIVVPVSPGRQPDEPPEHLDSARTPRQSGARGERSAAADWDCDSVPKIRGGAGSPSSHAVPRRAGEEGGGQAL